MCPPESSAGGLPFRKQDMAFPKITSTFLGVPIIRLIVYWGLCPAFLGNHHMPFPDEVHVDLGGQARLCRHLELAYSSRATMCCRHGGVLEIFPALNKNPYAHP